LKHCSEADLYLSQDIKEQIIQHLNGLEVSFKKYFPKNKKIKDYWIAFPFDATHFQSEVQEKEKLIEL